MMTLKACLSLAIVCFTLVPAVLSQNFYLSEGGPPGFPSPSSGGAGSPYPFQASGPAPTKSRPSFLRNPLAAASNLHKTVIAGIRAPSGFFSGLLPSASVPRPSIFSFAKPPRGFQGSVQPPQGHPSYGSLSPEPAASNAYSSYFGRPSGVGPGPSQSYFPGPASGSGFAGLPASVISALQSGHFDPSALGGSNGVSDQQEQAAATNIESFNRAPPRIRHNFGGEDVAASSPGSYESFSSQAASQGLGQGLSAASIQNALQGSGLAGGPNGLQGIGSSALFGSPASASSSSQSGGAPQQIAGYDVGVPVQLGFASHPSNGGSSGSQGVQSVGPAYQIDGSGYPSGGSSYEGMQQQQVQQQQDDQYSGLATGYGSGQQQASIGHGNADKSSYGQTQTFVVGSTLSYDGKAPTSYSSPSASKGYSSYPGSAPSGQSAVGNEALAQALKAYASGNVKYVPGKPAVPINHQLGQAASSSYSSAPASTSTSYSSTGYSSSVPSTKSKYSASASSSSAAYSSPTSSKSSSSSHYSSSASPKASASTQIRYSSSSGGLSYAQSAPSASVVSMHGAKTGSKFESQRTVGSSLKFGADSPSSSSASASSSAKKSS